MAALLQENWLITGAAGQLGGRLVQRLARQTPAPSVYGLTRGSPVAPGAVGVNADLADADRLRTLIRELRPRLILHVGAMTAVGDCFRDPAAAARINVQATAAIADAAESVAARLVFTSTDMVFDGRHAPYDESAPPSPLSIYGRSKLAAEDALRARGGDCLIVRIPLLFGLPVTARRSTFADQLAALRSAQTLRLFTDEFRTPVGLRAAAAALVGLARSGRRGLIHLPGAERLSRYEMIVRAARLLGIERPKLEPISRLDVQAAEPRPADLSLDGRVFLREFPELAPGPMSLADLGEAE